MKKYRRSMPDDTGEWCKFEKKNFFGSKYDTRNSVNSNASTAKSENLYFDVLLLSIAYKSFS